VLASHETPPDSLNFNNHDELSVGIFEVGVEVWNLILGRHRIIAAALISHFNINKY
jgi:hypothetical protein